MLQRAALGSGKYRFVELMLFPEFCRGKNHPAAGAAQCLVGRRRYDMRIGERIRMKPGCNQPGNMGNVCHQIRASLIRDLPETPEINRSRIRTGAADDQLRPALLRDAFHLIVIDESVFGYAIGDSVEIKAGEINRTSV